MSKKKKSSKAKVEVMTEEVVTIQPAEETMDDVADQTPDLLEMADLEGLDLEFAEDTDEDEPEGEPGSSTELESELLFAASEDESVEDSTEDSVEGDADDESQMDDSLSAEELAGTELASFESAEIENLEILTPEQVRSVVESILFATDKPQSIAVMKQVFKGTQVKSKDIREALTALEEEYTQLQRGFTLSEAGGGFQLRTKPENMKYLRQSVKARPFRLSGPALEVMSIIAYKQPATKSQIDEIRGVESGHLLRALMERHLVTFGERSDLPGKPMFYESTRKFLEIFGLRNLAELPSLSEIDQLIPEGIGEIEDKETLSDLTGQLSQEIGLSYSEGEDELLKITDELTQITTSSEFFEQEKVRMREKRDLERAQNIREAISLGETVENKEVRWLERYDIAQAEQQSASAEADFVAEALEDAAEIEHEATEEALSEPFLESVSEPVSELVSEPDSEPNL